jgi:outer membrane protein assembly factor BamB
MIYGGRNGQVIWHSYEVAYQWRAYQVSNTMSVAPQVHDGKVIVAGKDGHIMVLDAGSVTQFWGATLLDDITAPPAVSDNAVYVAGQDQFLRAMDLDTGRVLWKKLFETPLVDGPTLIGDSVYQQVPGQGLLCFEALPVNMPGGVVRWTCPEVTGRVITRNGSNLLVWDAESRIMTLVDANRGGVRQSFSLPHADVLLATEVDGGEIFAAGADGRIVQLRQQN